MQVIYLKSVDKFTRTLDVKDKILVRRVVDVLKLKGNRIEMPISKSLGDGLFELRSPKSQVRIFYCFYNNSVYLLHAITKKSNRIPLQDIQYARGLKELLHQDNI